MTEMKKIEKALKGTRAHAGHVNCAVCPYEEKIVDGCLDWMAAGAAGALEDAVEEIEQLHNQVYNLTLYLKDIFEKIPGSKSLLDVRHPGLPGYTPQEIEA